MPDVNNLQGQEELDTSSNKITPDEDSEIVKTPSEEDKKFVPYERFQEVYQNYKSLKDEVDVLKTQQPQPEEEEPLDWKEAEQRAVQKATAKIKEDLQKESQKNLQEEQRIEKSFGQLKKMGEPITEQIESAILRKMIETGENDVIDVYLQNKTEFQKQSLSKQQKQEGFVPPSGQGAASKVPTFNYEEIRGKSPLDFVR